MSDASGGPEPGNAARANRRRRLIIAGSSLLLLVIAVVVSVIVASTRPAPPPAAAPTTTRSQTPSSAPSSPPPSLPPLAAGPMNILVMGSDSRGDPNDQRSDMIMLIHLPADRQKVFGVSIMRDNWVTIPGHGESKINAGLSLGGPQLVVDTVSSLLNVHIDHYMMTDFDNFKILTDALGGIEVNVTLPFTATFDTHHTFTPGINKLDGQAALEFVRERYAFPDGDYQRVRDQQTFMRGIMNLLISAGKVRDPATAIALIAMVAPHLTVDPAFDSTTMAAMAYALRHTDPAAAVFFTMPNLGTGTSPDGQSIVIPDYPGIAEVGAALRADSMDAYAAAHRL